MCGRFSMGLCLALWLGCHEGMKARSGDGGHDAAASGEAGSPGYCGNILAVAVGWVHACALAGDGALWCWGDNEQGQLGDGTFESKTAPVRVASLGTEVVQVGVGADFTCAVKRDGSLWCWGGNAAGQLGNGKSGSSRLPEPVKGLGVKVAQVSLGTGHTCARTTEGSIWCWGFLGDGSTYDLVGVPDKVGGIVDATEISAGAAHRCALKADGTVWCWGGNSMGELGDGSRVGSLVPVQVNGLAPAIRVFARASNSCALTKDGTLWCWGAANGSPIPLPVSILSGTVEVALGDEHACARRNDGTLWCWGDNGKGQLGDGTIGPSAFPVLVGGITEARQVSVGEEVSCAVDGTAKLHCFGSNDWGMLGIGTQPMQAMPRAVASLEIPVAQLSASDQSYCARTTEGSVSCWGNSFYAQLGYGPQGVTAAPVPMNTLGTSAAHIASGSAGTSCAVLGDGGIWCWGMTSNDSGVFDRQPAPVQISGLPPARQVAVGWGHACALSNDGVFCWGRNDAGMIGDGSESLFQPVPTRASLSGQVVTQISSAGNHTCARTADGALWCWGANQQGQLGNGTTNNSPLPVHVNMLGANVTHVATGWTNHTCAALADGTAWCWGKNDNGQIGDGTLTSRLVPVQVRGLPSAVQLSAAEDHTCALTVDGEIWCWGRNESGQLGNGKIEPSSIRPDPVQAQAAGVVFVEVCAGARSTCARTADGSTWCWGTQNHGLQADGHLGYSPSPVGPAGCP